MGKKRVLNTSAINSAIEETKTNTVETVEETKANTVETVETVEEIYKDFIENETVETVEETKANTVETVEEIKLSAKDMVQKVTMCSRTQTLDNGMIISKTNATTGVISYTTACSSGNYALDEITSYIFSMGNIVKNIEFVTCSLLAFVKNNVSDFIKGSCFNSFEDYAKQMFNYNKSQAYELASIGERFVKLTTKDSSDFPFRIVYNHGTNRNELEKVDLTNLKITVKADKYGFRFGKTVLGKMLALNDKEINRLIDDDKIHSTMSVSQIKDVIKEIKAIPISSTDIKDKSNTKANNDNNDNSKKLEYKVSNDKDVVNAMCDLANNIENTNLKNMVLDMLKRVNACLNKETELETETE